MGLFDDEDHGSMFSEHDDEWDDSVGARFEEAEAEEELHQTAEEWMKSYFISPPSNWSEIYVGILGVDIPEWLMQMPHCWPKPGIA